MGVQKQIWEDFIVQNLYKDNAFLEKFKNRDRNVKEGKIVHIPQAGQRAATLKNPDTFPLTARKRVDSTVLYEIDVYATEPIHIEDAEKIEASYDKIADVLGDSLKGMMEDVADNFLYDLVRVYSDATAGVIRLRTTGAAVATHLAGATGNRKKFDKADLKKGRTRMNNQKISKMNRFALFPGDILDQLMDDTDLLKRDYALELDMRSGSIGRLMGFELMERPSVVIMDNTGTPVAKAPGSAAASTDNDTVLLWQMDAAHRARGEVKFYEDLQNPLYLGDIYNASVRFGGRPERKDSAGIIAIVQDAA